MLPDPVKTVTTRHLEQLQQRLPGYLEGLYLHGSLCWGEFFPGSDIDFVAATSRRPNETDLAVLQQIHRELDTDGRDYDGFYLPTDQLAQDPSLLAVVPGNLHVTYQVDHHPDATLITWHELAERGITVFGPPARSAEIFTDEAVLEINTRTNLHSYWAPTADRVRAADPATVTPKLAAWCVLGILRLHHLLSEHAITAKSAAGRWGLERLPHHRAVIEEALAWREQCTITGAYGDPADLQSAVVALLDEVLDEYDIHHG
ncbi:nucleotidyltransferase domain-containing protein [Calidifontibacter terrae]